MIAELQWLTNTAEAFGDAKNLLQLFEPILIDDTEAQESISLQDIAAHVKCETFGLIVYRSDLTPDIATIAHGDSQIKVNWINIGRDVSTTLLDYELQPQVIIGGDPGDTESWTVAAFGTELSKFIFPLFRAGKHVRTTGESVVEAKKSAEGRTIAGTVLYDYVRVVSNNAL